MAAAGDENLCGCWGILHLALHSARISLIAGLGLHRVEGQTVLLALRSMRKVFGASCPLVLLVLSISATAMAQAPPIRGEGSMTEFFQGRAIRTFSQFLIVDRLLDEGSEQPNLQELRVFVYAQPFAINLAPAPDFNVTVVAPLVVKRLDNIVQPGTRTLTGMGDMVVRGKYRFWKRLAPERRSDAAFLVGIKLPTGPTGAGDAQGNRLPIPAQIGTGSTDVFFQGSVSHADSGRGYSLFADLRYTANTAAKGYEFGDTLLLDWGVTKQLYPWRFTELKPVHLSAEVDFLFVHAGRDRNGGVPVASSGGASVFWAPGISAIIKQRWLVEASFQFPVTQQLNGRQLGQGWNVLFGTRVIY